MASEPSESVALASLRTSAPPSEMECDEKLALRPSVRLQGGDVERAGAFLLDLVVIDHGAVAGHDFGDGVGEVGARACAHVGLDDGALARPRPTRIRVRGCVAAACAPGTVT